MFQEPLPKLHSKFGGRVDNMCVSAFPVAVLIAFAALGPVHCFHRGEPCEHSPTTALYHLQYMQAWRIECKRNSSNRTPASVAMPQNMLNGSDGRGDNNKSYGNKSGLSVAMFNYPAERQKQWMEAKVHGEVGSVHANGGEADYHDPLNELDVSSPNSQLGTFASNSTEAGHHNASYELDVSNPNCRNASIECNGTSGGSHDQIHWINVSNSSTDQLHGVNDSNSSSESLHWVNVSNTSRDVGSLENSFTESDYHDPLHELDESSSNSEMSIPERAETKPELNATNETVKSEAWKHVNPEVNTSKHNTEKIEAKTLINVPSYESILRKLDHNASRQYAGPAVETMKHALQAAKDQDVDAGQRVDKALGKFRMAEDAKVKSDAASKAAADEEAKLTSAKATILRAVTAAKGMAVEAARAEMDAAVHPSTSTLSRKRGMRIAQVAVFKAKKDLNAIRGKLSAAEKAAASAQSAAVGTAQDLATAWRELTDARDAAAKVTTRRRQVEEQVVNIADQIARAAETFAATGRAKAEALQAFQAAKKELADAAHAADLVAHAPAHENI